MEKYENIIAVDFDSPSEEQRKNEHPFVAIKGDFAEVLKALENQFEKEKPLKSAEIFQYLVEENDAFLMTEFQQIQAQIEEDLSYAMAVCWVIAQRGYLFEKNNNSAARVQEILDAETEAEEAAFRYEQACERLRDLAETYKWSLSSGDTVEPLAA